MIDVKMFKIYKNTTILMNALLIAGVLVSIFKDQLGLLFLDYVLYFMAGYTFFRMHNRYQELKKRGLP